MYSLTHTMSSPHKMDFRSDTVTKPTPEMLQAMMTAELGDDVYGDDPTVHKLQDTVADLCGKEAALFVCSGVMSNQLALKCHLRPMDEVICDHRAHIYRSEQGGVSYHSSASIMPIVPEGGRTYITAKQIEAKINTRIDLHTPVTRVISLENTLHGTLMPLEEIQAIHQVAKKHGIIMHLDGARIWNASVISGIDLKTYCQYFDTVSLCMSKGLGAPIGSVLVGNKDTIALARRYRKLFGGGWRQAGILAGGALYAINNIWPRLKVDHENAKRLESGLLKMGFTTTTPVESNFVFASGANIGFSFRFVAPYLRSQGILITPNAMNEYNSRLTIHHQITQDHVDEFLNIIRDLISRKYIYRALSKQSITKEGTENEYYLGTEQEQKEGFLHFSTAKHIQKSVELYCSDINDLVLLQVDTHKLPRPDELKWEAATSDRGSDLFPHLYGSLPMNAVVRQYDIPKDPETKKHVNFPELK
jgi:threonine aldolase